MKETGALKKLLLVLLLLVLLPALFYSGFELNSISASEELIATIYRQQLDVILFSLNQYALDVANNWSSSIGILLNENRHVSSDSLSRSVERFLAKNSSIRSLVISDTTLSKNTFYYRLNSAGNSSLRESTFVQSLEARKEIIVRLLRYRQIDYRKLEPLHIENDSSRNNIALIFVTGGDAGGNSVVAMVLDERSFITEVLSSKLREAAGEEFTLAVCQGEIEQPVFATSSIMAKDLKQKKQLWLFPDYFVGIRLNGTTVEEITQSRFYRNIALIILLDVVLMIGVWIVYKNIRKQMELVRLKSDFVSNVSHELRTPLALIRMFAETLEMGRLKNEEKKREYYSTILQETERLSRLINNILDFSKMEAGKKEYNFQEIELNSLIKNLLETYSFHLQSEGFSPIIQLEESLPMVTADKEAVSEAIMNLMDNAVKYSNAEKYLRITTGSTEKNIFVEVEDRGIGIPSEFHQKIYENFFRVSGGLIHNVKGSGLGLALVKHIMDAHNGKIMLQSEPGKGSMFRLEFPLQKND